MLLKEISNIDIVYAKQRNSFNKTVVRCVVKAPFTLLMSIVLNFLLQSIMYNNCPRRTDTSITLKLPC